jgi:8-hydroxy-5-deazaflavin:NADPH oxidoreductase
MSRLGSGTEAQMKIATIGAGRIGGSLAGQLVKAGHSVFISNSRGPETLTDVADRTGATAATRRDAVAEAQVVVVTIPLIAVSTLPPDLLEAAADDVVVIDTNNYYPQRDGHIAAIENGLTESEWVAGQLRHDVVKAFNNIRADHIVEKATVAGDAKRLALPMAGNDVRAKSVVAALIDQVGFDAVDYGNLAESWRQQPGTPIYGAEADIEGVKRLLSEASAERSAQWKA